jgi:hypothetical protein
LVFSLKVGSHGASYPLRGNIPFGTISRGGTHGYALRSSTAYWQLPKRIGGLDRNQEEQLNDNNSDQGGKRKGCLYAGDPSQS